MMLLSIALNDSLKESRGTTAPKKTWVGMMVRQDYFPWLFILSDKGNRSEYLYVTYLPNVSQNLKNLT